MRLAYNAVVFLCVSVASFCQSGSGSGSAKTTGTCSPAISGSKNIVTIRCTGFTDAQAQVFSDLLNQVAAKQLDPTLVMQKLDDIKKGVDLLGPRRLTSTQSRLITEAMLQYKGQIVFLEAEQESETTQYAQDFANALRAAGLTVSLRTLMSVNGPPAKGTYAMLSKVDVDKHTVPRWFSAFLAVTKQNGIATFEQAETLSPAGTVLIEFGVK